MTNRNKNRNLQKPRKVLLSGNQGSSIVLVIVAIAFVGILASVILSLAMTNYQMKYTDLHAKDNFYSAETALDQIHTGLEGEVSNAFSKSYMEVFQKYGQYSEEQRENNFQYLYINYLRNTFRESETDTKYALAIIKGYLDPDIFTDENTVLTSTETDTEEQFKMTALSSGIVLKGLKIIYTDTQGYVSVISTDIRLAVPDITFTQSNSMPDLFEFSLVANHQLTGTNTGTTNIKGSVYGGEDGIQVNGASVWNFTDAVRVLTDKEISVTGPNAELNIGTDIMLWADNLVVDNGVMKLNGSAYIGDDLTLQGQNSNVVLNNAYYGYGNSDTEEANSSAIVVNGRNSSIDLSGLDKLLLSGNTFIGTQTVSYDESTYGSGNNKDILMGESLGLKSSQIAYLVPPECIGVNDGKTIIGKNPMTSTEYAALLEYANDNTNYPDFETVSFTTIVKNLGKTLSYYVPDYASTSGYQPIFSQINGDTVVYLYLVMDEDNSSRYFRDYYNLNSEKTDKYLKLYNNDIKTDEFTRITTNGNLLTYDTSSKASTLIEDTKPETADDSAALNSEESSYEGVFEALTTKLITNISEVSDTEKAKSVFENLILETDLKTLVNTKGTGKIFTFEMDVTNGSLQAVFVNNESTDPYTYGVGQSDEIRLIIATGDVVIAKNFTGLVIAKGTITIESGANIIQSNEEDLTKILQCTSSDDEDSKRVIEYFVNGSNYILNGTGIGSSDILEEDFIKVSDLIVNENWTKQ
ncbi:hypothetical protein [Lachnotalea glycerini]|uniref:Uncharacterized protein n=1 Tax=Lachnotalea glycerini TaxID=1763509 RepID=A0A371JGU8_9FIRM|nr:hypothetical protein [Lachnotalea glycerini]RDY31970.1 hypothetical protein CG710_006610 [Lachnotalea glycerini]